MKKIKEETVFNGRRIKVNKVLYEKDGQEIEREEVKAGEAVEILAITNDNKVLLVKQERTAIKKEVLGLPAGIIDKGEKPEHAAIRELEEETGYKARNVTFLRKMYTSCGYSDELIYVFYAENLEKTKQHLDKDEFLDVIEIPIQTLKEMLDKNEIITASSIIALMHYFIYGGKNGEDSKRN